tara:strand:+ start:10965 stop:11795 length:831 start_codon:yes stop_codon:yes gene_type:complete
MNDQSDSVFDAQRLVVGLIAFLVGVAIIVTLNMIPPIQIKGEDASGEYTKVDFSQILINRRVEDGKEEYGYFSVQAFMWIALCLGLGELWLRHRAASKEKHQLSLEFLPEDEQTILTHEDLTPIYKRVNKANQSYFLPKLIRRTIIQFRKSDSVDQANNLLNSNLELCLHELDLRYNLIRYVVWVIPTMGFIGTVIGIADALAFAGRDGIDPDNLLGPTTARLGVAFYTTLVALVMSGVLMLVMNFVQGGEERSLNRAGQYTFDNLINRLLEKKAR